MVDSETPAVDESLSAVLNIYRSSQKQAVAQVVLNGYNINQDESLGSLGSMRSFKIVRGDLWDEWNEQAAILLEDDHGQKITVRVAALPSDAESFGLIEFISANDNLKLDKPQ